VAFYYDIAKSTLINQRYVASLQRAVLRRSVRISVVQLSEQPVSDSEGPPVQHVVHAGRRGSFSNFFGAFGAARIKI
jgi:hypothetical protein